MRLKLLQDIGVFNVNVSKTFLSVCSLDSNNNFQHLLRESWHFLRATSSLLNSTLVSILLRLGGCHLLLTSLMAITMRPSSIESTLLLFLLI